MSDVELPEKPSLDEMSRPLVAVLVAAAAMWVAEIVDLVPGTPFDSWGIEPRSAGGLIGIPLAPFLHGGFGHLIGNTVPFVVLGIVIALGGVSRWLNVSAIVLVSAGAGTWLFGASGTVHIGASGVVFGYLTYLISRGFIAGRIGWIVGGIIIALLYGGALWGLIPRPGISFTGHLFGAVGGVAAAWILHADAAGRSGDADS